MLGYEDTPFIPGSKWRVHDAKRPYPRKVVPGTCSTPASPGQAPSDAILLFDGKDLSKWRNQKGGAAGWKVENGYMETVPKTGDIFTLDEFGDIQLHVEWQAPGPAQGQSLGDGNSGVFLFGLFELQVFDDSARLIYADGQAGSLYGQYPPLVNASRKTGEWQAYDIVFTAARFREGKLAQPAFVTVLHNGVVIQNHAALLGESVHRALPVYVDRGPKGPIRIQEHGVPVRYRNIWVRVLKDYDEP
jgi:hypothetical protein